MTVAVLGIDLAKRVFQLHGIDTRGRAVVSRRIGRSRLVETVVQLAPAVIAMEACCGAHHWGRRFRDLGIEVRLIHEVRSALRQERQERRARCRGHLRSGPASAHALRTDQEHRAAGYPSVASGSRAGDALAHGVDQPHPRSAAGVRHRLAARADAVPTGGDHRPR
jgi:hypothetical protein